MRTLFSVVLVSVLANNAIACASSVEEPTPQSQQGNLSGCGTAGAESRCGCGQPGSETRCGAGNGAGVGNPAAIYCVDLGYVSSVVTAADGSQSGACFFPDNTSCDEWAFFRGECGQAFSYCNRHGGTVANVVRNQGTFTTSQAICTLADGKQCSEQAFAKDKVCQ
ncbi:MAG: DUF333 domain-containing protein [Polyangiaceae bacterium]